jgi:hypothetical protein
MDTSFTYTHFEDVDMNRITFERTMCSKIVGKRTFIHTAVDSVFERVAHASGADFASRLVRIHPQVYPYFSPTCVEFSGVTVSTLEKLSFPVLKTKSLLFKSI